MITRDYLIEGKETYDAREQLKELGCYWSPSDKCWRADKVREGGNRHYKIRKLCSEISADMNEV